MVALIEKLEKLKQDKELLSRKIQRIEAKQKLQENKYDIRRKILVGTYFLEKAKSENSMDKLMEYMNVFLTKDRDRKLFNLPSKTNNSDK
jgi:hypothetical protein